MFHHARKAAFAAAVTALLAGCSGQEAEEGPRSAPKPDLSTLDAGRYSMTPRDLGRVSSEAEGRMVEAFRMGDLMPDFSKIDSSLAFPGDWAPITDPSGIGTSTAAVVEPILQKHGMVVGYFAVASSDADVADADTSAKAGTREVRIQIFRFRDAESARSAAIEIDAADFATSTDRVPVPIAAFPESHGHWRSGGRWMVSTLARGEFVIDVRAMINTSGVRLDRLKVLVERTFAAQVPLVDRFKPTALNQLANLQRDPEHLLGRLVNLDPDGEPQISRSFRVVGQVPGRAVYGSKLSTAYDRAGIDRSGGWRVSSSGSASIVRARDNNGARQWLDEFLRMRAPSIDHPVGSPAGVQDAKCFELVAARWADDPTAHYQCFVTFDRYVTSVMGADEADVKQRAAAQYALLVNQL